MPHTPQVKEHIRNGETYQINYTFNLHFTLEVGHGLVVEHGAPYRSSQHPPTSTLT
jgi:anthranilate/para-aminobenzoate synthase component I